MPLSSGTRLGPYEITAALGAGGMGEVYRARDTRLGRDVAVKVLPGDVARDPEPRARFEREARAVAALDHPHICGIYDVGEADGTHYLVMPLLDGQTLAARLEKGPLPIADALKVAGEIADALDKAHRQGIVHRDLKPANVMLTKGGAGSAGAPQVKLLDFGLAKLRPVAGAVALSDAKSATTTAGTAAGTILGTIHYMAPEQVEGKEADHRADIWALGAVLYEMVTGVRPFQGETAASVMGAILKDTPRAVSSRQVLSPVHLDRVVAACLEKDPDQRWQSCRDVSRELAWVEAAPPAPNGQVPAGVVTRWLPWGVAVAAPLLVAALMAPAWRAHRQEAAPEPLQLTMLAPDDASFASSPSSVVTPQFALSPDGRYLAFAARRTGARAMLWVRGLGSAAAEPLRGTEDAIYPFWSPDSRSVGFFSQGKLKVVDLGGGPPRVLTDAGLDSRGGTWAPDGTILFAPANGPLARVSSAGGTSSPATQLDEARHETSHRFPVFLPDGRHFLYATRTRDTGEDSRGVSVASLDSPKGKPVVPRTSWGARHANGHILFLRSGTLFAQPFDLSRLETTGEAATLAEGVGATTTGYSAFSVSNTGIVAHSGHFALPGQLQWFDRSGRALGVVGEAAEYLDFALSPDERTLAMSRVDDPGLASADIWLLDLARDVPTRFTSHPLNEASAQWSPTGDTLAFRSNRAGYTQLYSKRTAGAEAERVILDTNVSLISSDWSRDGQWILFTETTSFTGFDIRAWRTDGTEKPRIVVDTALNAIHGRLSPDGKWLAYATDESGEFEVFVQPFPGGGARRQVSSRGGDEPRWRRDGRELLYLATDGGLMSVDVGPGTTPSISAPRRLFDVRVPLLGSPYHENYAVSNDGQRFLVNTRVETAPAAIDVIVNWPALVTK